MYYHDPSPNTSSGKRFHALRDWEKSSGEFTNRHRRPRVYNIQLSLFFHAKNYLITNQVQTSRSFARSSNYLSINHQHELLSREQNPGQSQYNVILRFFFPHVSFVFHFFLREDLSVKFKPVEISLARRIRSFFPRVFRLSFLSSRRIICHESSSNQYFACLSNYHDPSSIRTFVA